MICHTQGGQKLGILNDNTHGERVYKNPTLVATTCLAQGIGYTSPPKMASQERIRTTQNVGPLLARQLGWVTRCHHGQC